MKKNFYVLAFLILCFCAVQSTFGQRGDDKFKELIELKNKSYELRENRSYRVKETTELYDEKGTTLKAKYTSTREVMPPDSTYIFSTNEAGGVTTKSEFIRIGDKFYVRDNGEKWKTYNPKTKIREASGSGVGVSSNVKILEETTFNGQPVKVYYEEDSHYSDFEEASSKTKYWFTTEGELLKTEEEKKNHKTNEISRIITIYEYDSNIKIEAPIK